MEHWIDNVDKFEQEFEKINWDNYANFEKLDFSKEQTREIEKIDNEELFLRYSDEIKKFTIYFLCDLKSLVTSYEFGLMIEENSKIALQKALNKALDYNCSEYDFNYYTNECLGLFADIYNASMRINCPALNQQIDNIKKDYLKDDLSDFSMRGNEVYYDLFQGKDEMYCQDVYDMISNDSLVEYIIDMFNDHSYDEQVNFVLSNTEKGKKLAELIEICNEEICNKKEEKTISLKQKSC